MRELVGVEDRPYRDDEAVRDLELLHSRYAAIVAMAEGTRCSASAEGAEMVGEGVRGRARRQMMTQIRGASSAKAKRELGWTLRYPSWRQGFPGTYGVARAA